ncbi:hypothetical protein LTR56_010555 [Elasticomyces elasticus]|nr:hypothetical protein LTR56_010555 [Elasticomyces elasticus]KAK3657971.1 hypothetical protein LTR22_009198 [Elasticomyces elasticus]KAK5762878.1 hypothetical protein LTS12_007067 [Elasticomyces elasticus]
MAATALHHLEVIDIYGRICDPITGNPLGEGQEAPGSIFYVPVEDPRRDYQVFVGKAETMPFSKLMEQLRAAGFEGGSMMMHVTPRPEDADRAPSPPPLRPSHQDKSGMEYSSGDIYRTDCAYCWAVMRGKERERGFRLDEIQQAAKKGCSTCDVLQQSIGEYAPMIFPAFSCEKVRIRQEGIGETRLLSDTSEVIVCFDEYQDEFIKLEFKDVRKASPSWPFADKGGGSAKETAKVNGRIANTSSYATVERIKEWMRTCGEEHHLCAIPPASVLPLRVVEVSNHRARVVYSDGVVAPYLTLSHCWGSSPVIRLLRENIHALEKDIPWTSLSKTFQDAILLTWRLGFRYIWIDSLCILQDSTEDWEFHASRMAQIYSKSQLTLSADGGTDGSHGLFSERSQEPYNLRSFDAPPIHNADLWRSKRLDGKDRDGCIRTFEWETRWRKAHAVLLGQDPMVPEQHFQPQNRKKIFDFEAYRGLVEAYTELDITKEIDRLPALSGVAFGRRDEYLAGMWRSLLIECLHWYPVSQSISNVMAHRPEIYRAPTWSWASVEAPIRHATKNFYKTKHSATCVAEVVNVAVTLAGVDPRGRVSDGFLRLRGPMRGVVVTAIGSCERENSYKDNFPKTAAQMSPAAIDPSIARREPAADMVTFATIRSGKLEDRCYLDIPLVLCRSEPCEVSVGQQLTCLMLSSRMCMVLKAVAQTRGVYTRVGLFKPKTEGWKFFGDKYSDIVIK